ncbi:MAG: hypothetical protein QXO86_01275 [Nitrososphaerota archaeon]
MRDTTLAIELRLKNTESKVSNMSSELVGLSGRLSTAESQLNNLGRDFSSLREGQRSINESLSDIQRLLDRNGSEVELLKSSLSALSAELESQSRMVTTLSLVVLMPALV